MAFEDNLWDRKVCWEKLGLNLASDKKGDCNLTDILGSPTSVEDIWSGLGSVGTNHGTEAGAAVAGKDY